MIRTLFIWIIPLVVFVAGLAATWIWYEIEQDKLIAERELKFDLLSHEATGIIEAKFREFEDVLAGIRGLFAASKSVERDEFENYIISLTANDRFPNTKAFAFIRVVASSSLESYISFVKDDTSLVPSGYPNFAIHPKKQFDEYVIADYLVPFAANETAFGFNLRADPVREEAYTFARDNNNYGITAPITLVGGDHGIVMFLPVYQKGTLASTIEQRQAAVEGYVAIVVDADTLFPEIIDDQFTELEFSVFDANQDNEVLYEGLTVPDSQFVKSIPLKIANRTWEVRTSANALLKVDDAAEQMPLMAAIVGIVGSIALTLVIVSLVVGQVRARRLVRLRTAQLEDAKDTLELATHSAGIGIWTWDVKQNKLVWDDQMYTLYGIKAEDFNGAYEAWQAGLHPEDKKPGDEAIQAALRGEKDFNITFRAVWPSGEIRHIRAHATVERDRKGEPEKMIGINFDVTHEAEVDRAKTEFVSLASHQLRTPLSAINWFAQMLEAGDAGELNEGQKVFIKQVLDSNKRMVDLVDSLLNVSRIDLGTFAIEPEDVDFKEVADSVIAELEPKIAEKQHTIERNYDEAVPVLQADAKLTRIVFQNLISNAVKYTGEHGTITVAIQKDREFVQISVADTGYGIPQAQQSRVFEKLFRADNVREMETDGTGLGLYIIKAIAEEVGGKAWFESEEGKGTTFYVTIPLSGMKKKEGNKELD